ncbi:GIN domain-containing protein [Phenylobacterium aquaticum]|uniref:GIN domain-containing protein n=1 Tax=Phenylobacterium aquaticum TaxID=1763816 RepID=UPI001F5D7E6D|nr:DUF2807 domain-containing protein [Phenylobacterium aquaticum]MCI3131344.1 DUF2807 domain-containing protein [Phenylobacterium aquaticum]
MRLLAVIAATGLAMAGGVANAASVEVKDAVARVVVIPEDRSDVKVEIVAANGALPLQVRSLGGKWIIDGNLDHRIRECHGAQDHVSVRVSGMGDVAYADMPQVVIRTPRDADVATGGAVFGSIGKTASLNFSNAGCGHWTIANVAGKFRLNEAGSGDVNAGSSGEAMIRIAGSGDVHTQAVAGRLDVEVAGSGDVWTASIGGPLNVRVAGSGDVRVAGGHADEASITIAGSGDVRFDGVAGELKAKIAGSGDVNVKQVTGGVSKAIVGSGSVNIG